MRILIIGLYSPTEICVNTMREITYREAVAEAMSEEMRRDESVYLMGEEVAEYNGAYKVKGYVG